MYKLEGLSDTMMNVYQATILVANTENNSANLQIMVRTSVQFEKNQNKTEGGVCTQGTQCPFTFIV